MLCIHIRYLYGFVAKGFLYRLDKIRLVSNIEFPIYCLGIPDSCTFQKIKISFFLNYTFFLIFILLLTRVTNEIVIETYTCAKALESDPFNLHLT